MDYRYLADVNAARDRANTALAEANEKIWSAEDVISDSQATLGQRVDALTIVAATAERLRAALIDLIGETSWDDDNTAD